MSAKTMELISTPTNDSLIDASATMYPSRMTALRGDSSGTPVDRPVDREFSNPTSSFYGYVVDGSARIETRTLDVTGQAGTYFAMPGPVRVRSSGLTVIIERFGYRCLPLLGSIEEQGRLAYIDGCSDSVLVAPARQGDPVLNLLHFPIGIRQSVHSHPSIRLGVVARGEGTAFGPKPGGDWHLALRPGAMFLLPAHEMHAFSTVESQSSLDVIAFHPDSDWGPTDGTHPMLNRTYLR
jgi:quercetin dioxygenase-like cupin family protein